MPFPDLTHHFHPVLAAKSLRKKPVKVTVGERSFALFRDHRGQAAALQDRCPHRHAPLSSGRVRNDGRLACPYHGWNFDAEGNGRSPSQPSLKHCDVEAFKVVERYGWLWLTAKDTPDARFPDLGVDGWDFAGAFDTLFQAPLHVAFDNFSEDEHTPWVHGLLGWNEGDAGAIAFHAENYDDRTEVSYEARQRFSPYLPGLLVMPGDRFHNEWVTRFSPVHTIYSIHWSDAKTGKRRPVESRIAIFFVPETEKTTRLVSFVFARTNVAMLRPLMPLIRRVGVRVTKNEVDDDARFIPTVANTPFELKGMRLGVYDKPIIRNHKLLETIYFADQRVVPTKTLLRSVAR